MAKAPGNEIMKPCLLCFLVIALDKHYDLGVAQLDNGDCRSLAGTVHDYASQTVVCQ